MTPVALRHLHRLTQPVARAGPEVCAIAVYAELGYRRLESANRQMAVALEMQSTLHEVLALIVDAETGERGYLLTGSEEYLTPYTTAVPKVDLAA